MAGYIILTDDKDMEGTRSHMRRAMRSGYRHDGTMPMMRHHDSEDMKEHYYRLGYKHGVEDWEDEHDMDYRRRRDSIGRYV